MFKRPFSFKGRIRRTELWLSIFLSNLALSILISLTSTRNENIMGIFILFFEIFHFWFALAQLVKRSHDIGNSGWLVIFPIYNPFVLLFMEGTRGENIYGEDPKEKNAPLTEKTTVVFEEPIQEETIVPTMEPVQEPIIEVVPEPAPIEEKREISPNDYVLSTDGRTLKRWLRIKASTIDMQSDPYLSKVTTINSGAFSACADLHTLILPQGLTTIHKYAFDGCNALKQITFPSSVTFLGEYLFGEACPEVITLQGNEPPELAGELTHNDHPLQAIYVNMGYIGTYRNTEGWQKYAKSINKIEK